MGLMMNASSQNIIAVESDRPTGMIADPTLPPVEVAPSVNTCTLGNDQRGRNRRITVLFVHRKPWSREALARALELHCRELRVLRYGNPDELAHIAAIDSAALVLLHLSSAAAGDKGIRETIGALRAYVPDIPVVALSEDEDAEIIMSAIEEGIRGYIPMTLELHLIVEALRFVAAGGTFVPAEPLLAAVGTAAAPYAMVPRLEEVEDTIDAALEGFTTRQLAVLKLLCRAKSNRLIARELDMQEATVKAHVRHIMRKLGATNRTQVALLAARLMHQLGGRGSGCDEIEPSKSR
jgi:DNA-binding NarL/FixJ family response regulator